MVGSENPPPEVRNVKVILKEDVSKIGKKGQLLDVSDGYARNYLLPRGLAEEATEGRQKEWENLKKGETLKADKAEKAAYETRKSIQGKQVTLKASAGESGKLFGSVTTAMIAQAKAKFGSDPRVSLLCADASNTSFAPHDACLVYNALPHFQSAQALIEALSKALVPGGRLTIAHGDSRQVVNARHSSGASEVSRDLMPAIELAELFEPLFRVDIVHDAEDCYLVSGVLK